MDKSRFRGVIPPVVTPLKEDRSLDAASFERTLDRMIDAGVDGLFIMGSSGEVAFMTDAERDEVLSTAVDIVGHRVPVMVGIIDIETNRVIEQAKRASRLDIDAVVATAPFYALGGPKETERHFRQIAKAIDLPLFAYDIPVCVHTKLAGDMMVQLGKEGVIQGVKDSSGDDIAFRWLILDNEDAGHPLQLLTGHEVVVDGCLLGGADGSVPGLANIDPEGYVEMQKAADAGDWRHVAEIQNRLAKLMMIVRGNKATVGYGAGVGSFKTALWQMGVFDTNQMREPVQPLVGEDVESIAAVLRANGIIDENAPVRTDWS